MRRKLDIIHEIDIAAPAERVFSALTTQEGLSAWYTPQTRTDPLFGGKVAAGSLIEFGFFNLTTLRFRVVRLARNRLVTWIGVDVPEEWKATPISFEIEPEGEVVNLTFSQTGFDIKYRPFAGFSYCWGQYMRSLKLFVETGQGEPFGSPASRAAGTTPRDVPLKAN